MEQNKIRTILAAVLVAAIGTACSKSVSPRVADPTSETRAPAGTFVGTRDASGNHAWLGIRYAEAPTGEQRWRAPRPAAPASGTVEAITNGASCPQFSSRFGGENGAEGEIRGDEDCLSLDIYAPADRKPGEKFPVMVWIHGGGNTIGNSGFYQGAELTRRGRVVVVAIQYRLGPMGFFRHAALGDGEDPADASGSYAVLDMIESLRWVQKNIASFGGDPDNVTIFGESAGGRNVFSLLLAPQAKGLFDRAIVQSGSLRAYSVSEAENPADDRAAPGHPRSSNEVLYTLLVQDGTAADRDAAKTAAAKMSPDQAARYLRDKSTAEIFAAYESQEGIGMVEMPTMIRDGHVLPARNPLESLANGRFHQVPIIIGTNRDETKLFLAASPDMTWQLFGVLPRVRDPEYYEAVAKHGSDNWKATGVDEPAAAIRASGHEEIWTYRFDWDEEGSFLGTDFSQMLGAGHALEIPFVFGHYDLGDELSVIFNDDNAAGRQEVEDAMVGYWSEFAHTGRPGNGGNPAAPTWKADSSFLVIDTTADGGLRHSDATLTEESVLAAIAADPRFDAAERCDALTLALQRQLRNDVSKLSDYGC